MIQFSTKVQFGNRSSKRARIGTKVCGALAIASLTLGGISAGVASPAHATTNGGDTGAAQLLAADPVPVNTTLTLTQLAQPTEYGDLAIFSAVLTPDGPANLSNQYVALLVDGIEIASGPLLYVGEGKFANLFPFVVRPPAGTHILQAEFRGVPGGTTSGGDVLPSTSNAIELTLSQRPTTTAITSAPTTIRAFTPTTVTAQVSSTLPEPPSGSATLYADGAELATAALDASANISFTNVVIPANTSTLTVGYLDAPGQNFAPSTSAAHAVTVTTLATGTSLTRVTPTLRADGWIDAEAVVTNLDSGSTTIPAGTVQFYVDGSLVHSTAVSSVSALGSRSAVYSASFPFDAAQFSLGDHALTAEFVPEPGFVASADTAGVSFNVSGVETRITPSAEVASGSTSTPATLDLTASVVPPNTGGATGPATRQLGGPAAAGTDGYVQAFVNGSPVGAPVTLVDGQGRYSFDGLAIGTHTAELRFIPATPGYLASSTTVTVSVSPDAAPAAAAAPAKQALSNTGGVHAEATMAAGAGVLLAGAALTALGARRRRA